MIKVGVKKQTNYPVSSKKIRDSLKDFLSKKGIVSDAEVSVVLVGKKKMLDIGRKFLQDKSLHDVLSFTSEEIDAKFVYPPDGVIHLGEIIVCYPLVVEAAKKEGKLIDEKVLELMKHGALHLLGIHHE